MDHFELRRGELFCEDVRLSEIADACGTPVYVYSSATLKRHYRVFREALDAHPVFSEALIAFAVKANGNQAVLATLFAEGAGADTVSEGEIRRALAAGAPPERIVFSGVGKTQAELAFALEAGILQINVESAAELEEIARLAGGLGRPAPVALRINPEVAAGGHAKIITAGPASKFGLPVAKAEALWARAVADPALEPVGLACHIGSQIADLAPLEQAFRSLRALAERLATAGAAPARLDLGGGLAAPYHGPGTAAPPDPVAFAAMAARVFEGWPARFLFEPGRVIAANAGVLLARVIRADERPGAPPIVVLDAGMNDLARPALYDAWHDIRPVRPRPGAPIPCDVVGPVCESGDTFARDRPLAPVQPGDLVALMSAGAYGAAMASEYNSRPLVAEALVRGGDFALVRPRGDPAAMIGRDRLPPWLPPPAQG